MGIKKLVRYYTTSYKAGRDVIVFEILDSKKNGAVKDTIIAKKQGSTQGKLVIWYLYKNGKFWKRVYVKPRKAREEIRELLLKHYNS